jgi:orotidine-5'-phosphate decarboxylase
MARNSGATAVVCDAEVVSEIRDRFPDLITIVPGVRMSHHLAYDQERTGTPQRLAKDGAHYAVVGRPITMAPDVVQAARDYVDALRLLN